MYLRRSDVYLRAYTRARKISTSFEREGSDASARGVNFFGFVEGPLWRAIRPQTEIFL